MSGKYRLTQWNPFGLEFDRACKVPFNESGCDGQTFRIMEHAFTQTLTMSRKEKITMRLAALSLGVKRVQEAKKIRGLFP